MRHHLLRCTGSVLAVGGPSVRLPGDKPDTVVRSQNAPYPTAEREWVKNSRKLPPTGIPGSCAKKLELNTESHPAVLRGSFQTMPRVELARPADLLRRHSCRRRWRTPASLMYPALLR